MSDVTFFAAMQFGLILASIAFTAQQFRKMSERKLARAAAPRRRFEGARSRRELR